MAGTDSELLTEDNLDSYIQDYNTVNISSPKELTDFCNNCADILENTDDWEKRIIAVSCLTVLLVCYSDSSVAFSIDLLNLNSLSHDLPIFSFSAEGLERYDVLRSGSLQRF